MLQKFLDELNVNGTRESTIAYYRSILNQANKFKKLPDWSKDDVNNYFLFLKNKDKESSIQIRKAILKRFFVWAGKGEIVQHLHIKMPKMPLKREDILTVEDINKMIDSTENHMYKALIAFLFESGARISEVLALKVDDITESDKGMIISIPESKTGKGYRRGLYVYSAQYIRNHITYAGLSRGDRLFPITKGQAWKIVKEIGKKAGIKKPISPHKFRHAQATDMVLRGYQETIIRKKLGWVGDSRMIARYQHIVDEDVINATMEKTGAAITKQPLANIKPAEPLKIADAAMQLAKLQEEVNELQDMKKVVDGLVKAFLSDPEIGKIFREWMETHLVLIDKKGNFEAYRLKVIE